MSRPTIQLANDTGASSTDGITSDDALVGTGDANDILYLTENGGSSTIIGFIPVASDGAWSTTPSLPDGAYDLTVVDSATNEVSADLTFTLDTQAPQVTAVLADDNGVSGTDHVTSDPTVSVHTEPNTVVTLTENGNVLAASTSDGGGDWVVDPTLALGPHTLRVDATDLAGNDASTTVFVDVVVASSPITAALANDTGSSNTDGITSDPTITGISFAGAAVDLTENGNVVGSTTAANDGSFSIDPALSDGSHTLVATSTDAHNNTVSSAPVTLDLETAAPAVTIALVNDTGASASDGVTSDGSISGTTAPLATVAITEVVAPTPVSIATLFGTGVNPAGHAAPGVIDQHWSVSYVPTSTAETPTALAGELPNTWVADTPTSAWIVPGADDLGFYDYHTTFDLTGLDPATAQIAGEWAAADVAGLVLNGSATGDDIYYGSDALTAFSLTSGFVSGVNTLDVYLLHTIDQGPTGLQIQLSGTADAAGQSTPSIVNVGTVTADSAGAWTDALTPAAGLHHFVASTTSVAGVVGTAALDVDDEPGAPPLSASLAHQTGSGTNTSDPALHGQTAPNSVIAFTDNVNGALGNATADATGSWTYNPAGLLDGAHDIQATATSPSGVASSPVDVVFTLATTPPALSAMLANDDGSSSTDGITTDPTISGTTAPGATVTFSEPAPATPVPITTLFGTGLTNAGALIADGSADPHYSVTYLPTLATTAAATIDSGSGLLASNGGPYADDTAASGWISPNSYAGGDYIYRTTFDLTGLDPTTAQIDGAWSVDNVGAIVLNGANTGIVDYDGAAGSANFSISSGFVSGLNTLEFYVYNGDASPTGLDVALTGSAAPDAAALAAQSSLGSTVAANDGTFSYTPVGLQIGAQTIDVSSSDTAGNTSNATVSLTLVTIPQSAPFMAPPPDAPTPPDPAAEFAAATASNPAAPPPAVVPPPATIRQVAPLAFDPVPLYSAPMLLPHA